MATYTISMSVNVPLKVYLLTGGSETKLRVKSVSSRCDGSSDRSVMVDPLLFLVPASAPRLLQQKPWYVLSSLLGMVHIKEPLMVIGKSSPCGGSRFPLSLSEWSFT